nr:MAG TPA: triphosphate pyrophosphohydrolase [Caudoviricetes sp.]
MNIPDEMNCWANFPAMVGGVAVYEALAEECMELAHAALKIARVLRGDNPIGETITNYRNVLEEEYTDVVSCAIALGLKPDADISVWKWERHKKRLEEMEGK